MQPEEDRNRERRRAAAARYRPANIDLLLVAEAPPNESGRYFYFEDVRRHDDLFRYVSRVLLVGSRRGRTSASFSRSSATAESS